VPGATQLRRGKEAMLREIGQQMRRTLR